MRTPFYLLIPPLISTALIALLLTVAGSSADAQSLNVPSATSVAQSAVTLTLSISTATPSANQPVNISVTLTNETFSQTVSNPLYTLRVESAEEARILVPESRREQHYREITPQNSDSALFTFYPITGGWVTMTAHVQVSVELSPPEQTKIDPSATPIALIIPPPSLEASIIYETAHNDGCMEINDFILFSISAGDGWGSFDCALAPGHSYGTNLSGFDSPADAMTVFNDIRGELALEQFHCHSAYYWSERPSDGPITYSRHGWTTGPWVNTSNAADDTIYGGAKGGSNGIYRTMERRNLLEPCANIYADHRTGMNRSELAKY